MYIHSLFYFLREILLILMAILLTASEKLLQELSHITHQNKQHIQNKYHLDVIEDRNGVCMIDVHTQEQMKAFIDTITLRRGQDCQCNLSILFCAKFTSF